MHVEICDELLSDEYRTHFEIEATRGDNTIGLSFYDGEPEDNTLSRNFASVYQIEDLIRWAYEAGKAGEELTFGEGKELRWNEDEDEDEE